MAEQRLIDLEKADRCRTATYRTGRVEQQASEAEQEARDKLETERKAKDGSKLTRKGRKRRRGR